MTLDKFLADAERRAFRIARLATHCDADALDIVQDAMIKLVQNYRHNMACEWPMLFQTILQNKIMDWHRRQRRQKRLFWWPASDPADDEQTVDGEPPDTIDTNPAHLLAQANNIETVIKLLETLPLRQQQAFLLRAWEGYDISETAQIMGCSEGSVKTHYFRAQQRIREGLELSHET